MSAIYEGRHSPYVSIGDGDYMLGSGGVCNVVPSDTDLKFDDKFLDSRQVAKIVYLALHYYYGNKLSCA